MNSPTDNDILHPQTEFDADLSLDDLLRGANKERLAAALADLLGSSARILDQRGQLLIGPDRAQDQALRVPLRWDLEPIGFLEAAEDRTRVEAAASVLGLLLRANARYYMASSLHQETVREDYRQLQTEHEAVLASEARYKALAESLEQQVAEKVKTIERAQRQLYQSEKLASVGQLAAGVAHEINNPIGFIGSNLRTALDYLKQLEELAAKVKMATDIGTLRDTWSGADTDFIFEDFQALLQESSGGAARVAGIVADLKGFSRVNESSESEEDVNQIITQVCNVARPQLQGQVRVQPELGRVPRLRCDPASLGQVFLGLVLNAAQAMDGHGEIRIGSDSQAGKIRVRVADNGQGIPADVLPRIFEPFFTTRDVGQGTGLGLTVCKDIVEAHGGRIALDSEVGVGTTVTILLPLERPQTSSKTD